MWAQLGQEVSRKWLQVVLGLRKCSNMKAEGHSEKVLVSRKNATCLGIKSPGESFLEN